MSKYEINISVRQLVEFIFRSGDIDNRRSASPEKAMQEGSRLHRMIQRSMEDNYSAEVLLRYLYETERYVIKIDGRADGIIYEGEEPDVTITIDEIKCVARKLEYVKAPVPVHLAQAKVYAYIYAKQKELPFIRVRMTYCNIDTEEIRYFHEEYSFKELSLWFGHLMQEYRKWADFQFEWETCYKESIRSLEFPFPYREGQRELAVSVYQTIKESKKLFLEAPTGVGKTISTLFPAIKAVGENLGGKIFYLTAKTITRTVAEDTYQIMRKKGLKCKTVTLTAKEKLCPQEKVECNPVACPYAKGHLDRINDALYDIITHEDHITREVIMEYADKHRVCPFEFSLDISLFADGIICDYNYVFDPHASLKRFFSEGMKDDYLFLIDEAHNLLDRGREMYSAVICKEDIMALNREIKAAISNKKDVEGQMNLQLDLPVNLPIVVEGEDKENTDDSKAIHGKGKKQQLTRVSKALERCNRYLLQLKKSCENYAEFDELELDEFVRNIESLYTAMAKYLEEDDDRPIRESILEYYFEVSHFLMIYEKLDDNYRPYYEFREDQSFVVKLFCVNPKKNLQECMMKGRSTILFSATLLPIQYYKKLLGGEPEDYEIYAKSTFNPQRMGLFIAKDVTSRYTRRNTMEFHKIASHIYEIFRTRPGNYMVFFPSHAFLEQVYDVFLNSFFDESTMECLIQNEYMDEGKREEFLEKFCRKSIGDITTGVIGFCVLGGIFSEGIDLRQDSLIGSIIVGPGLPQICNEREILKEHFDDEEHDGYDYAYRFPGMNKVLQAAGRVIRTAEDIGVVVLLEDRFLNRNYQQLFPREWREYKVTCNPDISFQLEQFWNQWK